MGPFEVLRAIVAVALLAFAPGYAWSLVLLPRVASRVERFVLGVGLSVAILVLALYVGNVALRIPISGATALVESALLTAAALGVREARRRRARGEPDAVPPPQDEG